MQSAFADAEAIFIFCDAFTNPEFIAFPIFVNPCAETASLLLLSIRNSL